MPTVTKLTYTESRREREANREASSPVLRRVLATKKLALPRWLRSHLYCRELCRKTTDSRQSDFHRSRSVTSSLDSFDKRSSASASPKTKLSSFRFAPAPVPGRFEGANQLPLLLYALRNCENNVEPRSYRGRYNWSIGWKTKVGERDTEKRGCRSRVEIAVKTVRADARDSLVGRDEILLLVKTEQYRRRCGTFRLNFSDGRNYRCRAIVPEYNSYAMLVRALLYAAKFANEEVRRDGFRALLVMDSLDER